MPSRDTTTFCSGRLISQLATATTLAGQTLQMNRINGAYITLPTGAFQLTLVRKTETDFYVELINVAAGSSTSSTTGIGTLGTLTRNISLTDGTDTTGSSATVIWPAGTLCYIGISTQDVENIAYKDTANSFSQHQTIANAKKVYLGGGTSAYVGSDNSGTDLLLKDANNSERTLSQLSSLSGTNDKVKVTSNDTTENYLLSKLAAGAGITISETNDGGDEDATIAAANTVATGHTGLATVPTGSVLIGAGTSNMTTTGPGTTGQVLKSNGTTIAIGDVPTFDKTVGLNVTDSSTLGASSTSDFNFDNHTQSISANDLATGVAYEFRAAISLTHAAGNIELCVKLGSTKVVTLGDYTPGGSASVTIQGMVFATGAAGASATVRAFASIISNTTGLTQAVYASTGSIATNGGLTLQMGGTFRTSNGGNNMIMRVSHFRKVSTSAF